MAITSAFANSFKQELFQGLHNITAHTFYVANYTSSATLDATTTAYSATNETSGTGYVAGGQALTGGTSGLTSGTAYITFNNAVWSGASYATAGCLVYNTSASNRALATYNFGTTYTVSGGSLTLTWPAAGATAMIRIA